MDKDRKMMYEQNENINKDRNYKKDLKGNHGAD